MQVAVPLAAADAFALVADFRVHSRWIPLTRIDVARAAPRVGDAVVAVSAGFLTDRMRVLDVEPPARGEPGRLRIGKEGPLLLGTATVTVTPVGPRQSLVRWVEDVWLAGPLPVRLTRALLAPAFAVMLAGALRGVRRDAAALARVRDARRP